jgi:hypothetical protein
MDQHHSIREKILILVFKDMRFFCYCSYKEHAKCLMRINIGIEELLACSTGTTAATTTGFQT